MRITLGDLQTVVTTQSSVTVLPSENGQLRGSDLETSNDNRFILSHFEAATASNRNTVCIFNAASSGKVVIIDRLIMQSSNSSTVEIRQLGALPAGTSIDVVNADNLVTFSPFSTAINVDTSLPGTGRFSFVEDLTNTVEIKMPESITLKEGNGIGFTPVATNASIRCIVYGRVFDT